MDTEVIRADWVGRVIDGRFALLRWLGGSEESGVFLTEMPGRETRKAAIKLIPADAPDAEIRRVGWATAASVSHPHIMRVFHTGQCRIDDAEVLFTVTEFAEEDLAEILVERPLTASEARAMVDPILETLQFLHGKGLVHGHLKPSNLLVVNEQLKLSGDCLHVAGKPARHAGQGSVYDAPEGAIGATSPEADMWSLGATLVAALTQHPPEWDSAKGENPLVPPNIPQPFADIAEKCLRVDPGLRCNMGYVRIRLEPWRSLTGEKTENAAIEEKREKAALPSRTVPRVAALVATGVVLLAVAAAFLVRTHHVKPGFESGKTVVMTQPEPASSTPAGAGIVVEGSVTQRVMPDVLKSASATILGKVSVWVQVAVDPSGDVSDAKFRRPPQSRYFSRVALEAARNWKFKPAEVDGTPVGSVWVLQFEFRRAANDVIPVEVSP